MRNRKILFYFTNSSLSFKAAQTPPFLWCLLWPLALLHIPCRTSVAFVLNSNHLLPSQHWQPPGDRSHASYDPVSQPRSGPDPQEKPKMNLMNKWGIGMEFKACFETLAFLILLKWKFLEILRLSYVRVISYVDWRCLKPIFLVLKYLVLFESWEDKGRM